MNIYIAIVLLVSTGVQVTLCEEDSGSRFDCEYKMMRKIEQLENEQELLKKYIVNWQAPATPAKPEVRRLEGKVRQLEEDNAGLRSSLSNVKVQIQLLQQGFLGGTRNSKPSGPQNPLCLPKNPHWEHFVSKVQGGGGIYGAEYRFGGYTDFAQSFFEKATRGYDVPCAVCLSSSATVLMIPAKRNCGEGWKKEYEGYLAAGWDTDPSGVDYFCLDKDPQLLPGTSKERDGLRIHLVESICEPLGCPPYHNGRELTCVICSR